uniref:Putative secreted protein n=1 Tax=Ixodes ricinus TaxID=34613 RepID=A0A6B0UAJ5_IXORI
MAALISACSCSLSGSSAHSPSNTESTSSPSPWGTRMLRARLRQTEPGRRLWVADDSWRLTTRVSGSSADPGEILVILGSVVARATLL